ncbi:hypothetical protein CONPUDRAFT_103616 [Coniophora puteana RWD-64-598 SS2]|uniref:Response regulatory domain-containing protein n=1 Tax=Coniophora puteana (strain RWD-64-598) TaxID=741705 RepID=A0A5M3MTF3_CONPW|nr:uncharacterized protein CONPUDRAFT_103616 [Coniophora puteana RWD-64-598 SS2]EIW82449.1 hypothetical protein CONPUDRAFT_103616 [Coniophora puteana RWD-64-598 SS2]
MSDPQSPTSSSAPFNRIPPSLLMTSEDASASAESALSTKFAVTWPIDPPLGPSVPAQLPTEHPVISSSDGESDLSEKEVVSEGSSLQSATLNEFDWAAKNRPKLQPQPEYDFDGAPSLPRLSRASSMPLASQLEHLRNPRREARTPLNPSFPLCLPSSATVDQAPYHELSLELADSVQMVVQTLLQVSPVQILDPVKEQLSACSLSVPTSCMSAVFTAMKNLNYLSANMTDLCSGTYDAACDASHNLTSGLSLRPELSVSYTDFDVGEMVQGVGDTLSGSAAHAGVDLVLFHGDAGMKHVVVKGDECGLSNALTHVMRQVINISHQGDSLDIGLFIASAASSTTQETEEETESPGSEKTPEFDGPLVCSFDITHHFSGVGAPFDGTTPTGQQPREKLQLQSPLLQRLLRRLGASLNVDDNSKSTAASRVTTLQVQLERGSVGALDAKISLPPQEPNSAVRERVASEPTLQELKQFAETLRGKKATLYASIRSSFAHHLTSYLTAWGLDVSHVSYDADGEGNVESNASVISQTSGRARQHTIDSFARQEEKFGAFTNGDGARPQDAMSFAFIDDDVSVLRSRLQKYRSGQESGPNTLSRKRPSLAAHHRPKSSPQVARALGLGPLPAFQVPVVIVHFTSLSQYKVVKDIIQCDLAAHSSSATPPPEIMIIPKPVGPRRFLTALHTAATKPIVDPFFVPIATTPISPGQHGPPFFNSSTSPRSPSSRTPTNSRSGSERSMRSPREPGTEGHPAAPPSPLGMSDNVEYFSENTVKLGASPSSGLVIQSPDGQPAGIFFHPKAKAMNLKGPPAGVGGSLLVEKEKNTLLAAPTDRPRGPSTSRRASDRDEKVPSQKPLSFSSLHTTTSSGTIPQARESPPRVESNTLPSPLSGGVRKPTLHQDEGVKAQPPELNRKTSSEARKVATPPTSPTNETPAVGSAARRPTRRLLDPTKPTTPPATSGKAKANADTNIVPPISVLIVDDNPINQTILSTFMRKKKIRYNVAKNGEEAVQKWKSGGFHLILMDIQMPVMDGITATKEIRRIEALNASSGFSPSTPQSDHSIRTPSEAPSSESRSSTTPYRSSVIIVALTASSLQSDRVAALAAGCNDFLTKPVSLQWLNNKIIEWGSIKALQMWADLRPETLRSITAEQAQHVAQRLHVPEGRSTPAEARSHSPPKVASDAAGQTKDSVVLTPMPPAVPPATTLETPDETSKVELHSGASSPSTDSGDTRYEDATSQIASDSDHQSEEGADPDSSSSHTPVPNSVEEESVETPRGEKEGQMS